MNKKSLLSSDIQSKIRHITIHTNRLLNGMLVGDSRTAQKGVGFEFNAIREYQQGDDIRFIDWYASSRMNNLLVREYIEERSRTILLVMDISHSGMYGSQTTSKRDLLAQISSVLALVAAHGNDCVGLILFSDIIEKYIPPARGKFHVQAIMEAVFAFEPVNKKTKSSVAFYELLKLKKRNALVFFISDCIDNTVQDHLLPVASMYDLVMVRSLDRYEYALPVNGFLTVEDMETGEVVTLDTRHYINTFLNQRIENQNRLFKKAGAHLLEVRENNNFVGDIIRFFKRRMRY